MNDPERKSFILPFNSSSQPQMTDIEEKENMIALADYWIQGLEKMRAIGEYYGFDFRLRYIEEPEIVDEIYNMADLVHTGTIMGHNCYILFHRSDFDEDIEISEPITYKENNQIQMENKTIFGVTFRPCKITLLPAQIKISEYSENDVIELPACCLYAKDTE